MINTAFLKIKLENKVPYFLHVVPYYIFNEVCYHTLHLIPYNGKFDVLCYIKND